MIPYKAYKIRVPRRVKLQIFREVISMKVVKNPMKGEFHGDER